MAIRSDAAVCRLLHQEQVVAVQLVVSLPGVHGLVKDAGIRAGSGLPESYANLPGDV